MFPPRFQDAGEISSYDLADAFHSMHQKGRYREMLVIADTCQASTLYEQLYSPGIIMVGSSSRGENSWSKGQSASLGTTLVDRFTDATLRFIERRMQPPAEPSLQQLLSSYNFHELDSHVGWVSRVSRPLSSIPVRDFFGQQTVQVPLPPSPRRPVVNVPVGRRMDPKPVLLPGSMKDRGNRGVSDGLWHFLAISSLALSLFVASRIVSK